MELQQPPEISMLLPIAATAALAVATDVTVRTTTELRSAIAEATPGTRILLAPGTYDALYAEGVKGKEGQPITIGAVDPKAAPHFSAGIHLTDIEHVVIEHVLVRGAPSNGINIDDGGTFDTPSQNVVLRHIEVRECGSRGNHDGVKLSGVVGFAIESCTIERWGRGGSAIDMVGCRNGTIEHCTIRDPISDRASDMASNGIQTKGGSRDIVIRGCRLDHAGQRAINIGGSTGLQYFRPKPEGFEAKDITVEGCTFIGSPAPVAFVGVDGAIVRHNVFYRPTKWFMRILQETRDPGFVPCRNGIFASNLIAYRTDEISTPINVGPGTQPESFRFERNYWFAIDAPQRSVPTLPVPEVDPAGGRDPLFKDAERGDLGLEDGSPARDVIKLKGTTGARSPQFPSGRPAQPQR
jgi:Right handed beta helix region